MYRTKEGKICVIYIRVSSERQVKGYSLDGQKRYLIECAERQGMTVRDVYVEEGKSGKSIVFLKRTISPGNCPFLVGTKNRMC